MKKLLFSLLFIPGSLYASSVLAQNDLIGGISLKENFELAKKFPMPSPWLLSAQCSACHGTFGTEFNEIIPPLAGMNKDDFIKKMNQYKTQDTDKFIVMGIITKPITDQEIEAMATFFSEQNPRPPKHGNNQKGLTVPKWAKMNKEAE